MKSRTISIGPAIGLIIAALLLIPIVGRLTSTEPTEPSARNTPVYVNPPTVTISEYRQIEVGMTYAEVVEIIGGEGVLKRREGYQNSFVTYGWQPEQGLQGAWCSVVFQNDRVFNMAQAGM